MIEGYCDGVCEPINPGGHAAWGALLRRDGKVIWNGSGYCGFGTGMSNNVAEYSGALALMQEAEKYSDVIRLYADSQLVVMQLNAKWKVREGLYVPYYRQAAEVYQRIRERSHWAWVPRDQNADCDILSKSVLICRGVKFRIQPEPVIA